MSYIASAASYYIKIWNYSNEENKIKIKEISSCMPHGSTNVECMEWNHDCSLIGSSGKDGCLILCIPESGKFSEIIPTGKINDIKNDEIRSMKFLHESNIIVFGGTGKVIKCWNRKNNKFINHYKGHKKPINSIDINKEENIIVSASENGDVLINSLGTKNYSLKNISKYSINKIIYSKTDNHHTYTIGNNGDIILFNTSTLSIENSRNIHESEIKDIVISPKDSNSIFTVGNDKKLCFFNNLTQSVVNTYKANDPLTSVSINSNGVMLACGTSRGQILLFDIRMNKVIHEYWAETKEIHSLKFNNKNYTINTDIMDTNKINNNRKRTQSIMTSDTISSKTMKTVLIDNNTISEKPQNLSNITSELLAFSSSKIKINPRKIQKKINDKEKESEQNESYNINNTNKSINKNDISNSNNINIKKEEIINNINENNINHSNSILTSSNTSPTDRASTSQDDFNIKENHEMEKSNSNSSSDSNTNSMNIPDIWLNPGTFLSPNPNSKAEIDEYINKNSNSLRQKLQQNVEDELKKNGYILEKGNTENTSVSDKILESVIDEGLQELKDLIRNDIQNMHLEILSQFHSQKYEIEKMFIEQQNQIGPLLTELQQLREKNDRYRCNI